MTAAASVTPPPGWPPARAGATTRLILIRHGEVDPAFRGRCYGRLDVGLSAAGAAQADRVAAALEGIAIDRVVTSPSRRAIDTATPLVARRGLATTVVPDLAELDFGDFEGKSYDELAAVQPEAYRAWMERPTEVRFPGGEGFAALRDRVRRGLRAVLDHGTGATTAVVGHGGPHRIAIADALGLPDAGLFRFELAHASASVVDHDGMAASVRLLNLRLG